MKKIVFCIFFFFLMVSCTERRTVKMTPWGTPAGGDTAVTAPFTLTDILSNGELIMLTLSGPETYYDYHQHGMGTQYLLCERFARQLGVSLRVDVCKDTAQMIAKLQRGEGDVIAFQLPLTEKGVRFCGARTDSHSTQWAVRTDNSALADTLNHWFRPELVAEARREERFLLSAQSIKRHVYAPMINRQEGVISRYDGLFRRYASTARLDWRMLAAQCYQESTFDPHASSWAGACGLMQIMPSTAAHLGLAMADIFNPEANIEAAARYLSELHDKFQDIDAAERRNFVLASYNGGASHIRDAMALTRKYGGNPHRWSDVSVFVERLSQPQYYNDPIVNNGYMRGYETVDYVARIRQRYAQYRGFAASGSFQGYVSPQKARHRNRFER